MCSFIHPEVGLRAHIVRTARGLIGKSRYCYLSEECRPPKTVNCAVLVQWVFAQHQVRVPPVSPSLFDDLYCSRSRVQFAEPGDLLFGQRPGRLHGHVGILTHEDTVIHASVEKYGVIEDPLRRFTHEFVDQPRIVSLLTNSVCLTAHDIGRYLRGEFAPEIIEAIERHATNECFDCEFRIEHIRRGGHVRQVA